MSFSILGGVCGYDTLGPLGLGLGHYDYGLREGLGHRGPECVLLKKKTHKPQ